MHPTGANTNRVRRSNDLIRSYITLPCVIAAPLLLKRKPPIRIFPTPQTNRYTRHSELEFLFHLAFIGFTKSMFFPGNVYTLGVLY